MLRKYPSVVVSVIMVPVCHIMKFCISLNCILYSLLLVSLIVVNEVPVSRAVFACNDTNTICGTNVTGCLYATFESENPEALYETQLVSQIKDIQSMDLKVAMRIEPPETEFFAGGVLKFLNGTGVPLTSSSIEVLWDLRDALDLTLDIVLVNEWDELFQSVETENVELISYLIPVFDIFYKPNGKPYYDVVHALIPLASSPSMAYFKQPSITWDTRYLIFEPFQPSTWNSILVCWIACAVVCHLIYRLSKVGKSEIDGSSKFSMSEIILWIGTVANGKGQIGDTSNPGIFRRSLCVALMSATVFTVLTTAVYTANIVLHFKVETRPVNSPDDLLRLDYQIASWSKMHIPRLFQEREHFSEERKINVAFINTSSYAIMKKLLGLEPGGDRFAYLTLPDGFVFLDPRLKNYEKELCEISSFASQAKTVMSTAVRKGSAHRNVLNWKILQLIERGINFRHQKHYSELFVFTCHKQSTAVQHLSFQHVFFVFVIWIVGATFAVVFVICENVKNWIKKD